MPSRKDTIDSEQAYADYLLLGADRSLRKLHQLYTNATPNPPSLDTLKQWSKKHTWQKRLKAVEQQARVEFEAKAAQMAAIQQWDAAQACRNNAESILSMIACKANNIELKNGADVRALVESAVSLLRTSEVISGGVSERIEQLHQPISQEQAHQQAKERVDAIFTKLDSSYVE